MKKSHKQFLALILAMILAIPFVPSGLVEVLAATGRPLSPIESVEADDSYALPNTDTYLITTTLGEKVRVVFYKDDMFRIWLANGATGNFTEADSDLLLVNQDYGVTPSVTVDYVTGDTPYYSLKTPTIELRAYENPFRFEALKDGQTVWKENTPLTYDTSTATQVMATDENEYFYGGGMQVGYLSHKGRSINISRSGWTPGTAPSPVPFYMSTNGYGVFRNTFSNGVYDYTSNTATEQMHRENRFDAFYFYGPSFEKILDDYTNLTGRPTLIPRWGISLGDAGAYRQEIDTSAEGGNPANSGSQYPNQAPYGGFWHGIKGTVGVIDDFHEEFVEKDMPLGWMLPNDGYGCEYNKATHPGGSLGDAAAGLMEYNVRTGLWIGQPQNYTSNNYTYGNGTDAGFQKEIEAQVRDWGVRLYKIDVAWSSQYNLKGDMENIFKRMHTNLESVDERGFLITVYGWAGGQRYATLWSGDQSGTADYTKYHIPTILGASMSGYPYSTSDQASIYSEVDNLYIRDLQMKTLVPTNYTMNNWAGGTGAMSQSNKRPGAPRFTEEEAEINRSYLKLKQQLIPYVYAYARQSYDTGAAIVRPMVYNYQNDPVTYDERTQYQYMTGDWLLAAPVYDLQSYVRDDIYLPEGRWVDYWTGQEYFGPATISVDAPLDTLPLFVRGGAIIPMYQEHLYDGQQEYNGKQVFDTMIFDLYPEGDTTFTLYEDDGHSTAYKTEDAYTNTLITSNAPTAGITGSLEVVIDAAEGNDFEGRVYSRKNLLMIHSGVKPDRVELNGGALNAFNSYDAMDNYQNGGWFYDATEKGGVLYVKTPDMSTSEVKHIWVDKYTVSTAPELEVGLPLPTNVEAVEMSKSTIMVNWDEVPGATTYDLEINGFSMVENVSPGYLNTGLEPESTHSYRVRARNATQISGWTLPVSATTLEDSDKNVVPKSGMSVIYPRGHYGGDRMDFAIDDDINTMFHTASNPPSGEDNLDFDLGGMFMIDKFAYMPRDNRGNGTVTEYKLFTSMDGDNFTEVAHGTWTQNEGLREVTFEPTLATYFRFQKIRSIGNFISGQEIWIYRTSQDIVLESLTTGKDTKASSVWAPTFAPNELTKIENVLAQTDNFETAGGYMPSHLTDGRLDTTWQMLEGSDFPATIDLHLPGTSMVHGFKYYPPQVGEAGVTGNITEYALYAVTSGNQTTFLSGGSWADDGEAKLINFRPTSTGIIRFVVKDAVGGKGAASQVEVLGEGMSESVVDRSEITAIASSDGVQGTVSEVNAPNAIDGNLDTFHETTYQQSNWNTEHWPAYFTFDLGKPRVLSQIQYAARSSGAGALRGYDVYYSNDGVNFFLASSGVADNSRNGSYVELDYNYSYPVRYIRIATSMRPELTGETFLSHMSSGGSAFAYNVGNHFTVADMKFFEDVDATETGTPDPNPIVLVPYEALTATTNKAVDGAKLAANAVDGNPSTYWASENGTENWNNGKWDAALTVDLGGARRINKIVYTPRQDSANGRLRGYEVLYSTDNGNTFQVGGVGYGWNTANEQKLEFDYSQPVTHIQIRSAVFGEMLSKLDLTSAPAAGEGAYAWGSGTQLAIGNIAIYEDPSEYVEPGDNPGGLQPEPNYRAEHATDGNLETAWSSANGQQATLTVDLGEEKVLDYARVVWGNEKGRNFTVESSIDGENWITIKTVSNNTVGSSFMKLDEELPARYVRMNGTNADTAYTLHAFDVFGEEVVTGIQFEESEVELAIGERITLKPVITPATARDQTLIYTSSDTDVATVREADGLVIARSAGQTVITAVSAADKTVYDSYTVTVISVPVEEISLNMTEKVIAVGEMAQLEATIRPANATNQNIIWVSEDESVVEVSGNGFVTAKGAGTTSVLAISADNEEVQDAFHVMVADIIDLVVDNEAGTIKVLFDELPTDVLKMSFSATYSYTGAAEEPLELNNMTIDETEASVSFAYKPFGANDIGDEVIVSVQYKGGAVYTENIAVSMLEKAVATPRQVIVETAYAIEDMQVVITYDDSCDLFEIRVNDIPLEEGEDYTWDGTNLTYKAEYLESLDPDLSYTVVYAFTGGLTSVTGEIRFVEEIIEAAIESVTAENGRVIILLDDEPSYDPEIGDFELYISVNNGQAEELNVWNFVYDRALRTVAFNFSEIPETEEDQLVVIEVSYQQGPIVSAEYTIDKNVLVKIETVRATNGQLIIELIDEPTIDPDVNNFIIESVETLELTGFEYIKDQKQVIITFEPLERAQSARVVAISIGYAANGLEPVNAEFTVKGIEDDSEIQAITAINGLVTAVLDYAPADETPEEHFEIVFKSGEDVIVPANLDLVYDEETLTAVYTFDKVEATTEEQVITVTVSYKNSGASASYTVDAISESRYALQQLVKKAETMVQGPGTSEEDWNAFLAVLESAKAVLVADESTDQDCQEAAAALRNAIDSVVDKDALRKVIDTAKQLNEAQFTEETWAVLVEALLAAEEVEATSGMVQSEVDAALTVLLNAIDGLEEPFIEVESIKINSAAITVVSIKSQMQLSCTVNPTNATIQDLTWESSNPAIATVDETGYVIAKSAGMITIKATAHNGTSNQIILRVTY